MASIAEKLDAVKVNMLRMRGESLPNSVRSPRAEHGRILRRAAQIAGYESDKELAADLSDDPQRPISKSQLSEWFSGDENPQTWRFERHPRLGPALLIAQAEAQGVEVKTTITLPQRKVG